MPFDYVLITPARNEAAFIEKTLESVVAQTVLPKRWIIVSDGSTDGTDEIVRKYQPGREWLELTPRSVINNVTGLAIIGPPLSAWIVS